MIIRVLDENRANKCDELLTKLIHDEKQYDDSIAEDFIVKDYFKNIIKNQDNILLCYEEDIIIKGYVYLKYMEDNNLKSYLIDGLYVDEQHRNKGIATKLLEEAIKIIKKTDVQVIDINVMANNSIAVKLYESLGFNNFKISLRKRL